MYGAFRTPLQHTVVIPVRLDLLPTAQECFSYIVMCTVQGKMYSTYLPTAVPSLSVTSMVKGTVKLLSVLSTSTWFSPSGTEYAAGSKNTDKSVKHGEEEEVIHRIACETCLFLCTRHMAQCGWSTLFIISVTTHVIACVVYL